MFSKKIITALLLAICVSWFVPVNASANTTVKTEVPKEVRAQQIESRLMAIRELAKTSLSKTEKKELRKETKSLKREARSKGIYLSVGAIIIIILLLILLL